MNPSEHTILSAKRLVNVDIILIAQGNATGGLVDCYRDEVFDGVDVNGLENGLRTSEDDGGIPGDVCLGRRGQPGVPSVTVFRVTLRRGGGHPNAQYSEPGASIGDGQEGWLA